MLNKNPILILGPVTAKGGISTVIKYHVNYLREKNIPIVLINTTDYFAGKGFRNIFIFFKAFFSILKLKTKPAGVHIHLSVNNSFYRKFILLYTLKFKYSSIPYILHIHHGLFHKWIAHKLRSRIFKSFLIKAEAILVPNPYIINHLSRLFPEIGSNLVLLNNPIHPPPPSQIKPKEFSKPYNILYLGYLRKIKNSDILLKAIEKICYSDMKVKFIFAGPGGDNALVKQAVTLSKRCLKKFTYLNRWIDTSEKKILFGEADFFIHVSEVECFPMVICEAMAWGLPMIAASKGGVEYLTPEKGAFWLNEITPDEIYNVVSEILRTKKDVLTRMSNINRERAIELYKYPVGPKLIELYKRYFHL